MQEMDVKDEPAEGSATQTPRKKLWTGTKNEGQMRIKQVREQQQASASAKAQASSTGKEVGDNKPAWQRLHEDFKERQMIQAQREEKHRQAAEDEARILLQQVMRKERLPVEQIEGITKRLYSDGLEKQKQQKEQAIQEHDRYWAKFFGAKTTGSPAVFRGVALYEAFMRRRKNAKPATSPSPVPVNVDETEERRFFSPQYLQKLIRWGTDKQKRLERLRQEQDLREKAELAEMSVHRAGSSQPARYEQLYLDAQKREQRLKEAQSAAWGLEDQRNVLGVKEHMKLCLRLYNDAQRRAKSLELRRNRLQAEEASELEAQSVHAAAKQGKVWSAQQLHELTERVARPLSGQSSPSRSHSAPCTPRRASPQAEQRVQKNPGQLAGKQPRSRQSSPNRSRSPCTPRRASPQVDHPASVKLQSGPGHLAGTQGQHVAKPQRDATAAQPTTGMSNEPGPSTASKPAAPCTPRSSTVQAATEAPKQDGQMAATESKGNLKQRDDAGRKAKPESKPTTPRSPRTHLPKQVQSESGAGQGAGKVEPPKATHEPASGSSATKKGTKKSKPQGSKKNERERTSEVHEAATPRDNEQRSKAPLTPRKPPFRPPGRRTATAELEMLEV